MSSLTRHASLICLGAVLAAACGSPAAPAPDTTGESRATSPADEVTVAAPTGAGAMVRWVAVRSVAGAESFRGTGQLLAPAAARAELTPLMAASVVRLQVELGQSVEPDDVLLVLLVPEATRAQAQLDGENLRQAAYRARLSQLERLQGEGLARASELAEAKARLLESQAIALEAKALLDTLEATGLRRRGKYHELRAPIAGVVTELTAAVGGVRGPSDGPLLIISGGRPSQVEARFPFSPPLEARYELREPGANLPLQLISRSPQLSAADASPRAWFSLQGTTSLPQGSLVRVGIVSEPELWVVPLAAIRSRTGDATTDSIHTRRAGALPVVLLATVAGEALVRASLRSDDEVRVAIEGTR